MGVVGQMISAAIGIYAGWLAMEILHEAGHVLHAVASGGRVARVVVPLIGFSRTDLSVNHSPAFVAWGGAIWGSILPLSLWAACARGPRSVRRATQLFAGFCLVANGLYLGIGWIDRTGDAGDLLRHDTPVWALCAFGAAATGAGLSLWHRIGVSENGPHQA